ncbi:DUF6702 family protein [Reichenbachiella sp.]|uniref:DUF6702 family protein n=1 Tax=Reichenbachiella sp. TaxID=2184521 RepID=UPI003B5B0E17
MRGKFFALSMMLMNGVFSIQAHDLNFGLFELFEEGQAYYMEIRLDKVNLVKAVGNDVGTTKEDWNCALSQYLNDRMSLAINGQSASLEYTAINFHEEVVIISAKVDLPHTQITDITVSNTVLLETIENQTNIIKATFHNKKRSFRLSKDRISTIIKYEL